MAVHKTEEDYVQAGCDEGLSIAQEKRLLFTLMAGVTPEGEENTDLCNLTFLFSDIVL